MLLGLSKGKFSLAMAAIVIANVIFVFAIPKTYQKIISSTYNQVHLFSHLSRQT